MRVRRSPTRSAPRAAGRRPPRPRPSRPGGGTTPCATARSAGPARAAPPAPTSRMSSNSGPVDVARQQHRPLHPRVAQHLQRRRQVARRSSATRPAPSTITLSKVNSVAGEELLDQRRVGRRRRRGLRASGAGVGVVEAERADLRAGAGGRLDDQREADLGGERRRRPRARRPAGGGRPASPPPRSTSFIAVLVAEVRRGLRRRMPGMPSASRACAMGTCSLLQRRR